MLFIMTLLMAFSLKGYTLPISPFTSSQENYSNQYGKIWLSPDGKYFAQKMTCPMKNDSIKPENYNIIQVFNSESLEKIYSFLAWASSMSWSLDSKSIYTTMPSGIIKQYDISQSSFSNLLIQPYSPRVSPVWIDSPQEQNVLVNGMIEALNSNLGFVPTYKINDQVDNTMLILKHGWKSLKDPESSDYGYVHAEDDPRVDKALLSENVFRWWVNSDGVPIANRRLVMSNRGYYEQDTFNRIIQVGDSFEERLVKKVMGVYNMGIYQPYFNFDKDTAKLNKSYVMSNEDTNTTALYLLDNNSFKPKALLKMESFDLHKPVMTRAGDLFGVTGFLQSQVFIPLTSNGKRLEKIIEKISGSKELEDIIVLSISDNGKRAAVRIGGNPNYFNYIIDLDTGEYKVLPSFCKKQHFSTTSLWAQTKDQQKILNYLSVPKNYSKNTPLIVSVHGGPHVRDNLYPDVNTKTYLDNGMAVLRINYRGSFGFGKNFIQLANGRYNEDIAQDIIESTMQVLEKYKMEPEKIILSGQGFGGYLVLSIAASEYASSFDAFVALMAITDPLTQYKERGPKATNYFHLLQAKKAKKHDSMKIKHNKPVYLGWNSHDEVTTPENLEAFIKLNDSVNLRTLVLSDTAGHVTESKVINSLEQIIDELLK